MLYCNVGLPAVVLMAYRAPVTSESQIQLRLAHLHQLNSGGHDPTAPCSPASAEFSPPVLGQHEVHRCP